MVQLLIYNANSNTKRSNNNTKSYFQKKNISKKIIFKKSEFYLVTTKQVPSIPMEKGTLQPQSPRVLRRVSSNNATSLLFSTSNVQLFSLATRAWQCSFLESKPLTTLCIFLSKPLFRNARKCYICFGLIIIIGPIHV